MVGCGPLGCGGEGGPGVTLVGLVCYTISWYVRGWQVVRCFRILSSTCLCSSFLLNGISDQWVSQIFVGGRCACCSRCQSGSYLISISFLRILVGVGNGSRRNNKIISYVLWILPSSCWVQHIGRRSHHVAGGNLIWMVWVFHLDQTFLELLG